MPRLAGFRDLGGLQRPDARSGRRTPQQGRCGRVPQQGGCWPDRRCLDAEVLQEIIRRFVALDHWEDGRKVYLAACELFPEVLPVTGEVMDRARELVDAVASLSVRDALHAAMIQVHSLEGIFSFDRDFDRIPGCRRIQI